VTGTVAIPFDEEAEECIVGTVVATRFGAQLAHERLTSEHFYLPGAARAFGAAVRPEVASAEEAATLCGRSDARFCKIAELADVDPRWLARCVAERPTMHDLRGVLAARVVDAARRRHVMRFASDLHCAAAEGSADDLERLLVGAGQHAI
jgi:replicative DNA helicase